jgi:FkbM family methyltransferase
MMGPSLTRDWVEYGNGRSDKEGLALVLNDFYLYVDSKDSSVAYHLINEGYWESWITSWMTRTVQPDWHCIDIGANFGYYTGVLSRLTDGAVLAFEPNPDIADMLQKSIDFNKFDNVTLKACALGSEDDTLTLSLADAYQGSGSLLMDEDFFKTWDANTRTYEVPVKRLDDSVGRRKRWDFIKIDVEGWEPEVFKGAEKVLSYGPLIAVEISPDHPVQFIDKLFKEYDVKNIAFDGSEEVVNRTDIPTRDWWMLVLRPKE